MSYDSPAFGRGAGADLAGRGVAPEERAGSAGCVALAAGAVSFSAAGGKRGSAYAATDRGHAGTGLQGKRTAGAASGTPGYDKTAVRAGEGVHKKAGHGYFPPVEDAGGGPGYLLFRTG